METVYPFCVIAVVPADLRCSDCGKVKYTLQVTARGLCGSVLLQRSAFMFSETVYVVRKPCHGGQEQSNNFM